MDKEHILVIDNEERMCLLLQEALSNEQLQVDIACDGEAGLRQFQQGDYRIVITDLKMPRLSGLDLLDRIKQQTPTAEVILMTAFATAQTAVDAMKRGAYDYLIKPFDMEELRLKVERLLAQKRLESENLDLRQQLKTRYQMKNIIGNSGKMQDVFNLLEKIYQTDTTVLIRGESGTGKELIAVAIHQNSPRAAEPFIAVNCAAIPENLLESELFGYEKGAFTGADHSKKGRFELAGTGTIFLDEIGDLSPNLQMKLLRVLQNRQIEHLGGTTTLSMPARILAATNRDLEQALKQGQFRQDLYYRINVFPVFLPPLRDRKEDIPVLVEHFIKKYNADQPVKISATAEQHLLDYSWPGNVRELENVIERAILLSSGQTIESNHLPAHLQSTTDATPLTDLPDGGIHLGEVEQKLIQQALLKAKGNKSKAATLLGITRRKLYSMMERLRVKE